MPGYRWIVFILSLGVVLDLSPRAVAQDKPRTDRHGDPLPAGAIGRLGTTRLRHGEAISALAFLPDGKTIASLGDGSHRTVQLWDLGTGTARMHYPVGNGAPGPAAFSPDRTRVAIVDIDGFTLFDIATGQRLYRQGPPPQINHMEYHIPFGFSGDGRILARISANGGDAFLNDVATGKELHTLILDQPMMGGATRSMGSSLTLSPDGKLLVTSTTGKSDARDFVVWELASGKRLHMFQGHSLGLVIFAADGKTLAVATSNRRQVVLHETAAGKELHRFNILGADVWRLAFAPDGKSLAIATPDEVHLWDMQTFEKTRTLPLKGYRIDGLVFSRDGSRLATLTHDRVGPDVMQIWQLPAGAESWSAHLPRWTSIAQCVFSDDGAMLAVATSSTVRLWDVACGNERPAHAGHHGSVIELAVAPDGRQVATVGDDGSLRLWDTATHEERAAWTLPLGNVLRAAFAADSKSLTLRSKSSPSFAACDLKTGRVMHVSGPKNSGIALAPDGRTAAWEAQDGTVGILDVWTGKEQARFSTPREKNDTNRLWPLRGVFSPDAKRLAATADIGEGSAVWQWDLSAGQKLPPLLGVNVRLRTIAYAPDSRMLACLTGSAGQGGVTDLRFWEVLTGQECQHIECSGETALSVAFAPDGRRLALGCEDGSIRLWDLVNGKALGRFTGHRGSVLALQFSLDGKALYSASSDTTVLIWDTTRRAIPEGPPAALDACWADLAGGDAGKALRAIGALASDPKHAVPFLRGKLKRSAPPDAKEVRRWIAELDSDEFETREKAHHWLTVQVEPIEPAIHEALKGAISLELRRRLEQVLETFRVIPPGRLRLLRSVQSLELIGNAEARAALQALADGPGGSLLTREAQESLQRLNKRAAAGAER